MYTKEILIEYYVNTDYVIVQFDWKIRKEIARFLGLYDVSDDLPRNYSLHYSMAERDDIDNLTDLSIKEVKDMISVFKEHSLAILTLGNEKEVREEYLIRDVIKLN